MKSLALLIAMLFVIGCVEQDELDIASKSQAIGPGIGQGNFRITDFDRDNLQLVGVVGPIAGNDAIPTVFFFPSGESYAQLSFPLDLALPEGKCGDTAEKWIWALNKETWDDKKKSDHVANELLSKLARDNCTLHVIWKEGPKKEILALSYPAEEWEEPR